jgi:hypothetical protein
VDITSAGNGHFWRTTRTPQATAASATAAALNRPRACSGPAAVVTTVTANSVAATAMSECGWRRAARCNQSTAPM